MIPEKAALAAFWGNKRFWLVQSALIGAWGALAVSWFWLPDAHIWGLFAAFLQGFVVLFGAFWLIRQAVRFYGKPLHRSGFKRALLHPRFYLDFAFLAAIGLCLPYLLIHWRPPVSGFAAQTTSLAIRFTGAYLIAVSAWLILMAILAQLGTDSPEVPAKSSSGPLSPQSAQPNP